MISIKRLVLRQMHQSEVITTDFAYLHAHTWTSFLYTKKGN